VHLDSAAILRPGAPPSLDEIRASVPETWSPALGHLAESLAEAGIVAGVFGSFAWQYRAQGTRAYVTATSDIDLLFTVPDGAGLDRLFRILERHHAHFPVLRIDGEIWLPDGGAVAWRELAAHSDEGRPQARQDKILVKSLDRLDLRCRDTVLSQFRRSAA
jgi:phosphoribosyl-dephospho-CoA transferase